MNIKLKIFIMALILSSIANTIYMLMGYDENTVLIVSSIALPSSYYLIKELSN